MSSNAADAPIVFLHLQKTGGSTVHHLLKEQIPEERFATRGEKGHINWGDGGEQAGRVISGHVTAREVRRLGGSPRVFTVLREPADRLLSHFYFLKSYTVEHLEKFASELLMRIKSMSLREFLLDSEVENWLRDFYVKVLDPRSDHLAGGTCDTDRAIEFLGSCEIVGTTDELEGFVDALFTALDLEPPQEIPLINTRRGLNEKWGFEPVEVRSPDPHEQSLIEAFVEKDLVLYSLAKRRQSAPRS